jgi:uncharacterized protein YecE (DUF72 family)
VPDTGPGRTPDIRVGISGWTYRPWRGVFYPPGLRQADELRYAASVLGSVEINGSFYSLHRPEAYRSWRAAVPDDFVFAVKGPRFVTHMKRLLDVRTPLANFFASGVLTLGPTLGPLLWQLPPTLAFDPERVAAFLDLLPRTTAQAARLAADHDHRVDGRTDVGTAAAQDRPLRHALEVRHPSFDVPAFRDLAQEQGVAVVVADSAGRWPVLDVHTADLAYARLHGDAELYVSGYDDQALDAWAERVRGWAAAGRDVYVYLDNDVKVRAPFDAMGLARRLGVGPPPPGPGDDGIAARPRNG